MNIFYLDPDPTLCAQYHCDKHVVKIILETAQLLCSAHWIAGATYAPYKLTHKNHPCAVWTRESLANYNFLLSLGISLCDEYEYRYRRVHKTWEVIQWCRAVPLLSCKPFTPPPQALPEKYKSSDTVSAYREYYRHEKRKFAKWTRREEPEWFKL